MSPLDYAHAARDMRVAAREPGINQAEVIARIRRAEALQLQAECGVHPHGDRSEEARG